MTREVFYTAFLMGGLGNQMFQIAHTISQSIKNGVGFKFNKKAYTPMQAHQPTKYLENIYRNIPFEDFLTTNYKIYKEDKWSFTPKNILTTESTIFHGYFQSNKNFYGNDDYFKDIFQPDENTKKIIFSKYPELMDNKNISIHIRRGDYLKIPNILPTIDISYIDKCLQQIQSYDNIFVLSDDKTWVKENIKYQNSIIVDGLEDYEELWLMSLCTYNIMSNSTFSWWGSFLNKNKNKEIFCPNIWFGPDGEKNYNDIYIDTWNKINVNYKDGKLYG